MIFLQKTSLNCFHYAFFSESLHYIYSNIFVLRFKKIKSFLRAQKQQLLFLSVRYQFLYRGVKQPKKARSFLRTPFKYSQIAFLISQFF